MVIRNFGGWKDIFWEKVTWKSVTCKKNQITSKFKRQDPFLERIKNKNCPGFWRPGNGHPMLYTLYNIQCILNYRLFCSKGLLDMSHWINLLVDLRLQRSSSFVESCKFSLALTQVWMIFCSNRYFVLIFRSQINFCLQTVQFFCRISYFYFLWSEKFDKLV